MTKPLSPAAQAVLEVVNAAAHCGSGRIKAAAALRAAADQVVPQTNELRSQHSYDYGQWDARDDIRTQLLAIAAELGAQ